MRRSSLSAIWRYTYKEMFRGAFDDFGNNFRESISLPSVLPKSLLILHVTFICACWALAMLGMVLPLALVVFAGKLKDNFRFFYLNKLPPEQDQAKRKLKKRKLARNLWLLLDADREGGTRKMITSCTFDPFWGDLIFHPVSVGSSDEVRSDHILRPDASGVIPSPQAWPVNGSGGILYCRSRPIDGIRISTRLRLRRKSKPWMIREVRQEIWVNPKVRSFLVDAGARLHPGEAVVVEGDKARPAKLTNEEFNRRKVIQEEVAQQFLGLLEPSMAEHRFSLGRLGSMNGIILHTDRD